MSEVGVVLQESVRPEREARTIMALLTRAAEEEGPPRRRTLKDCLRFGCCGATWVFRPPTLTLTHPHPQQPPPQHQHLQEADPGQVVPNPTSGTNLAAALAAERQFRGTQEPPDESGERSGTPWRVSLMRLLQETEETEKGGGGGGEAVGDDSVCCVCMGRNKGAAFIPCGHTFCRVCSRELWLNRGTCPLCNRSILEILDIF